MASLAAPPAIEPGVAQSLATWRARHYGDVRYAIAATVEPGVEALRGEIELRVTLKTRVDLILDWRPAVRARATVLEVNGRPHKHVRVENEHIIIPADSLTRGQNTVRLGFVSPIAHSGSAITRFRDSEDSADYIYSLFVPSDASSAFPCFDQPDLKARFQLALTVPIGWRAISNAPELDRTESDRAEHTYRFAETEPISTYLFAFAAGPFETISSNTVSDPTRLFVRKSRLARAQAEGEEVLRLNREARRYFEGYFAHPFPFAKYDLVLIPQFPYGGMEHAGATFLREAAVLFPSEPSEADRLRRAQLVFHETCHQWFGNLVTMRWFDDLWLKEGFANFMAAKATEAILPDYNAWLAFHLLKTAAYRTDATLGTTAIYQSISNLSAAKSAYGSIVYSKAPAVLRQAEFYLGDVVFQRAVRAFVSDHRYAAAGWRDLVAAFERAAGRDLKRWADAWVKRAGMPTVRTGLKLTTDGRIATVMLQQQRQAAGYRTGTTAATTAIAAWPMRIQLLIKSKNGGVDARIPVVVRGRKMGVSELIGAPAPAFIFANDGDFGYGGFPLDALSRAAAADAAPSVDEPLLRALLWSALWESVRDAEMPPREFVERALKAIPDEQNELIAGTLLSRMQTAYRWYLAAPARDSLAEEFERMLVNGMSTAATLGLRITFLRTLMSAGGTQIARSAVKQLLAGERSIPGMSLSSRDRFRMIARLLALDDPDARELLRKQTEADRADDAARYGFAAAAAEPNSSIKARYFDVFLGSESLAESWIEEALAPFNTVEQSSLTLPFLQRALEALPRLKRERKIFFVNAWLGAFLGGQWSDAALETVNKFLTQKKLEPDLRLKVLEAVDDLERTVAIRRRYAH